MPFESGSLIRNPWGIRLPWETIPPHVLSRGLLVPKPLFLVIIDPFVGKRRRGDIYSEKIPDAYSRMMLSLGILQGLNEGLWALVGNESAKNSVNLLTILTRPEQIMLLILYLGITVLIVRAVIPAIRELFS